MGYAVQENGYFRAVTIDMELQGSEIYYEDLPNWAYEKFEAGQQEAQKVQSENSWRIREVAFVTDQLIGIEDADPTALPGSEAEWRAYRTKVRAWKEGADGFPDSAQRPARPQ